MRSVVRLSGKGEKASRIGKQRDWDDDRIRKTVLFLDSVFGKDMRSKAELSGITRVIAYSVVRD